MDCAVPGPPLISIVVPVYNKRRFLVPAIDSMLDAVHRFGDAELILVDNGSTDGSYELLLQRYGREGTILQVHGGTISAVRNRGASIARGSYLSFVDCDCVIPPDFLSRVVAVFEEIRVGVTGCAVGLPQDASWIEEVWHHLHRRSGDGFRTYINSGNLAVKRTAFDLVGGFDEHLVTGEDSEICQRLTDAGFRPYEAQVLSVAHLDNPKTLAQFYRKEVWRGLGMFGTVRRESVDKPTAMTVTHLLALTLALVVFAGPGAWSWRLAIALMLPWLVPTAAIAYRVRGGGRLTHPLRAVLLYQIYFLARVTALFRVALGGVKARLWAPTRRTAPHT
jgi:glycosyltransferase involved in cell wall biosynthesis